jgi:hypothetical protein
MLNFINHQKSLNNMQFFLVRQIKVILLINIRTIYSLFLFFNNNIYIYINYNTLFKHFIIVSMFYID